MERNAFARSWAIYHVSEAMLILSSKSLISGRAALVGLLSELPRAMLASRRWHHLLCSWPGYQILAVGKCSSINNFSLSYLYVLCLPTTCTSHPAHLESRPVCSLLAARVQFARSCSRPTGHFMLTTRFGSQFTQLGDVIP